MFVVQRRTIMKISFLVRLVFLLLPLLVLAGEWLTSKSNKSIGGGGYDLSGLYYLVFSIGYFILYEVVLLFMGAKQNAGLLIAGGVLLLIYIIYAVITIR